MLKALYFFIFILGLSIGSFLNAVIYRLQANKSLLTCSRCPRCQKELGWHDLVPLISFIFLKGKCRYCQKSISWQYPLVELVTGLLFVFIVYSFSPITSYQLLISIVYYLLIACLLVVIFVYDLKHYLIPDKVIYPAIVTVLLYRLFGIWDLGFDWSLGFGIWDLQFHLT